LDTVPVPELFALVDLYRLALADSRVSGYFAEEDMRTGLVLKLISKINTLDETCPYSLRIVTLQAACNLFTTPLFPPKLLGDPILRSPLISLVASSLLDSTHAHVRVAATSLAFNIASWNHRQRLQQEADLLDESSQVELAASLIEALDRETSSDGLKGLVLALGLLAYGKREDGELKEVLQAMGTCDIVRGKKIEGSKGLIDEVAKVLS
jgi:hypothetical protein